ncbi:helix-turn-helix domain-containing protein [Brachybacterium paraconglomeratum]
MTYMTRLRGAELTLAERAVLTTLWTYTNADLANAYPSRMRLAADSGVSRDGVRKALRGLEDKGFIHSVSRGGWTDEGNRANVYNLTLPRGATEKPPVGDSDTPPGATESPLSDPSSDPVSDPPIAVPVPETPRSSLRSPSLSERRPDRDLLELVRDIARAQTDDDYEAASNIFIEEFENRHGEELGYWDYGWSEKLDNLVRKHGIDYGTAKWLGIFTNTRNAS